MVYLEGFFSQKEYADLTQHISKLKKQVAHSKKSLSVADLKKLITDFQQFKLNIEPAALDSVIGLNDYNESEDSIDISTYNQYPDLYYKYIRENSQSDYGDLRLIFQSLQLKSEDVFYDLGTGYGRVCTYGGVLYPNVRSVAGDVLKENFEDGTVFYMLNPFPTIMTEFLPKLRRIALKKQIRIIAGHDTATELKQVDWLQVEIAD